MQRARTITTRPGAGLSASADRGIVGGGPTHSGAPASDAAGGSPPDEPEGLVAEAARLSCCSATERGGVQV